MRLDPYRHPRRGAVVLASCSLLGLIGLLVFDGVGDIAAFALAAAPLALGLRAWWRASGT